MKDTMIYTKKAYNQDKQFGIDVMDTMMEASSMERHLKLMEDLYPDHTIEMLWTHEHGGPYVIERSPSCRFDSSMDGMCAYKDEADLDEYILYINDELIEYEEE